MNRLLIPVTAAAVVLASACGGARVQSAWSNPAVSPAPFRNLLAAAITKDPGRRQMMEDAMTAALRDEAPAAETVASRSILSESEITDEARVRDHLALTRFDGAIVMRITDVERGDVFVPGRTTVVPAWYRTFWGYYRYWAPIAYEPGYIERRRNVQVETLVYALPAGDLVYSAISRPLDPASADELAARVARVVARDLRQRGFTAAGQRAGAGSSR